MGSLRIIKTVETTVEEKVKPISKPVEKPLEEPKLTAMEQLAINGSTLHLGLIEDNQ